jgi:hypothetical protein
LNPGYNSSATFFLSNTYMALIEAYLTVEFSIVHLDMVTKGKIKFSCRVDTGDPQGSVKMSFAYRVLRSTFL